MFKLKGSPENPAANVLQQCDPHTFDGARASKPFTVRINAAVGDAPIKNQAIKQIQCPKIPPWIAPEPSICQKPVIKKSYSDQEVKTRFLDHDQVHSNTIKLYTDGSESANGVGLL